MATAQRALPRPFPSSNKDALTVTIAATHTHIEVHSHWDIHNLKATRMDVPLQDQSFFAPAPDMVNDIAVCISTHEVALTVHCVHGKSYLLLCCNRCTYICIRVYLQLSVDQFVLQTQYQQQIAELQVCAFCVF